MILSCKNNEKKTADELIHEFYDRKPFSRYLYYWRKGFTVTDVFTNFVNDFSEYGEYALTGLRDITLFLVIVIRFILVIVFFPISVTILFFGVNKAARQYIESTKRSGA
jgi:hypothetical protein